MSNKSRLFYLMLLVMLTSTSAFAGWGGFNSWGWGNKKEVWIDLVPELSWSTNAWEAGSVDTGETTITTLTISNTGNDVAEDVATTVTGVGFRLYSSVTFGNISSGKTRVAKVEFKPTAGQAYSGFLNYSAPNIARTGVALSGTGIGGATAYKTNLAEYWDFTSGTPLTGVHSSLIATNSGATFDSNGGTFTNDGVYKTTSITGETGAMSVLIRFKKGTAGDVGRLAVFKRNNTGFAITALAGSIQVAPGNGLATDNVNWGASTNTSTGRTVATADTSWHALCATFSVGAAKTVGEVYLDGVTQTGLLSVAVSSGDSTSDLFITGAKWTGGIVGEPALDNSMISHTAIWNRALTAEECQTITTGTGYLYGGW